MGRRAERGPGTFVPLESATRPAADVVELTYRGAVVLPTTTMFATSLAGPWEQLR